MLTAISKFAGIAQMAIGDPLLNKVDLTAVLIVIVKTAITFAALLISVMLMVWFERKVISDLQNRIGPERAGPFGLLQTLADGIKLFFKEDLLPAEADKRTFRLAPYIACCTAFLAFSIVPLGGTVKLFGRETLLQLADPPIGILFMLAISSISVYGVMLAGWSSGSKYPLIGSVRASAQMISYEASMGLSCAAVVLAAGTLSTQGIVASQSVFNWNLWVLGVVPFVVFLISSTAELNRPPFDLVEAESELVGGFHTEYSSLRFALFFLAEFMNTITMSAFIVTLFLGGPYGPDVPILTNVSPVWFLLKLLIFLFLFVWIRATVPRMRYDQLMDLGWKLLIPLSMGWLMVIAAVRLQDGRGRAIAAVIGVVGLVAVFALLSLAQRVGDRRSELTEVES